MKDTIRKIKLHFSKNKYLKGDYVRFTCIEQGKIFIRYGRIDNIINDIYYITPTHERYLSIYPVQEKNIISLCSEEQIKYFKNILKL